MRKNQGSKFKVLKRFKIYCWVVARRDCTKVFGSRFKGFKDLAYAELKVEDLIIR